MSESGCEWKRPNEVGKDAVLVLSQEFDRYLITDLLSREVHACPIYHAGVKVPLETSWLGS